MTGRDPICLKCNQVGHISARCDASYCRQCREYHTGNCRQRSWAAIADERRRQQDPEEMDHEEESMGQAGDMIPPADVIELESNTETCEMDVKNIVNTTVNTQENAEIDRIMSSMDLNIISETVTDIGKQVDDCELPSPSKSFVEDDFPPLQPPALDDGCTKQFPTVSLRGWSHLFLMVLFFSWSLLRFSHHQWCRRP